MSQSLDTSKRLLYLLPSAEIWGGEVCFLNFLACLDRKRYKPLVVCPSNGSVVDCLEQLDVEVSVIGIDKYDHVFRHNLPSPGILWQLISLIRRKRVALIHSYDFSLRNYANAAALLTGVPLVYSCHVLHWAQLFRDMQLKLINAVAAELICVSEAVREGFLRRNILDPTKLQVIHPGVALDRFCQNGNSLLRSELHVSAGTPLVGIVARFDSNKNLQGFLDAGALVGRAVPETRFVVIGENRVRATVPVGLSDQVTFLGRRDDVSQLLLDLDIIVSTSLEEGFGLTLVEAMASGKPVVSTSSGGPQDIVVDGETGFLVPPGDNQALAESLVHLLTDPELARQMGQCGRRRAERFFDVREHTRKVEELYESTFL